MTRSHSGDVRTIISGRIAVKTFYDDPIRFQGKVDGDSDANVLLSSTQSKN